MIQISDSLGSGADARLPEVGRHVVIARASSRKSYRLDDHRAPSARAGQGATLPLQVALSAGHLSTARRLG